MRIVNLMEDTEGSRGCAFEHGLCFYIETKSHKILMDTGASELIIANAKKKGIRLSKVDTVVLSHGHYDHGGGLLVFLKLNPKAKVYMQKTACEEYYSEHKEGHVHYIGLAPEVKDLEQIIYADREYKIDEELSLFSGIGNDYPIPSGNHELKKKTENGLVQDVFSHEQCLVVQEDGRRILFSGCAHHGILNVMKRYMELYKAEPDAVISGFHMMKKSSYTREDIRLIRQTATELKKYRTKYYTCHCTGEKPYEIMKDILWNQIKYIHCGDELEVKEKRRNEYMKWHKFFAWATVFCFCMVMITGYKKK